MVKQNDGKPVSSGIEPLFQLGSEDKTIFTSTDLSGTAEEPLNLFQDTPTQNNIILAQNVEPLSETPLLAPESGDNSPITPEVSPIKVAESYSPPTAEFFNHLGDATGSDDNYSPSTNAFDLARWVAPLPEAIVQPPVDLFQNPLTFPSGELTSTEATRDTNGLDSASFTGPINDPPVAIDDNFTTTVTPGALSTLDGTVATNDSDPNGDALAFTLLTPPTSIPSFTFNQDGSFQANLNGSDYEGTLTDTFLYQVTDTGGLSSTATGTINVNFNHLPLAFNDSFTYLFSTPSTTLTGNVLLNNGFGPDTDSDGDPLTTTLISGPGFSSSFTLNPDGTFSYLANPGTSDLSTTSFQYQLSDGQGGTSTATASITFHVPLAPIALNDLVFKDYFPGVASYTMNVLQNNGNGVDYDPNPWDTFSAVPQNYTFADGLGSLSGDGTFTFTPFNTNVLPTQKGFLYQIIDSTGLTDQGLAQIAFSEVIPTPETFVFNLGVGPLGGLTYSGSQVVTTYDQGFDFLVFQNVSQTPTVVGNTWTDLAVTLNNNTTLVVGAILGVGGPAADTQIAFNEGGIIVIADTTITNFTTQDPTHVSFT